MSGAGLLNSCLHGALMDYDFQQPWHCMSIDLQDELLLACCGTHEEWLKVKDKCPPRIAGFIGVMIAAPFLPIGKSLSSDERVLRQQEILSRLSTKPFLRQRLERAIRRSHGEQLDGEEPDIFIEPPKNQQRTEQKPFIEEPPSGANSKHLLKALSYPLFFIGGTAPLPSIAALIFSVVSLGGWGWLLFLWFGFIGMFALGLAKQLLNEADTENHIRTDGLFSFGMLGFVILGTAYMGGLWFWISGAVHRISLWYGLLAPIVIFLLVVAYNAFRARKSNTKKSQSA